MLSKENKAFLTKIKPNSKNKAFIAEIRPKSSFKIAPKISLNIGLNSPPLGTIRVAQPSGDPFKGL